jgi:hypothetical protein
VAGMVWMWSALCWPMWGTDQGRGGLIGLCCEKMKMLRSEGFFLSGLDGCWWLGANARGRLAGESGVIVGKDPAGLKGLMLVLVYCRIESWTTLGEHACWTSPS